MLNKIYTYPGGLRGWWGKSGGAGAGDNRAFSISSPYDEPAGVEEGDIGIFFPTGYGTGGTDASFAQPVVYRWDAAVPFPLTGQTFGMWLPIEVYEGTPQIEAYLIGGESNTGLVNQGFSIATVGTGSVSFAPSGIDSLGDFTRVQSLGAGNEAYLNLPTLLGNQRFYLRCDWRNNFSTGTLVGLAQSTAENNTQYTLGKMLGNQANYRAYIWNQTTPAWALASSVANTHRNGGQSFVPVLSQNAYWSFDLCSGDEMDSLVVSTNNGIPYTTLRRDADSAGLLDPMTLRFFTVGAAAPATNTVCDVRRLFFLTW